MFQEVMNSFLAEENVGGGLQKSKHNGEEEISSSSRHWCIDEHSRYSNGFETSKPAWIPKKEQKEESKIIYNFQLNFLLSDALILVV